MTRIRNRLRNRMRYRIRYCSEVLLTCLLSFNQWDVSTMTELFCPKPTHGLPWIPLMLLPILKSSACRNTHKDWLRNMRFNLYHRFMDHIIADLNELCSRDIYLRLAGNRICWSQAFYHVLVLDGAKVTAATMCDTTQCPVYTCLHEDLDRADCCFLFKTRNKCKQL
jgi:hypothetical protein